MTEKRREFNDGDYAIASATDAPWPPVVEMHDAVCYIAIRGEVTEDGDECELTVHKVDFLSRVPTDVGLSAIVQALPKIHQSFHGCGE